MASGLLVVRAGRAVASVGAAFLRNLSSSPHDVGDVAAPILRPVGHARECKFPRYPDSLRDPFFPWKNTLEKFHFPKEEAIVAYLTNCLLTKGRYSTEKKLIEAVARRFANQQRSATGVEIGVGLCFYDLSKHLDLPGEVWEFYKGDFVTDLKDCANRK